MKITSITNRITGNAKKQQALDKKKDLNYGKKSTKNCLVQRCHTTHRANRHESVTRPRALLLTPKGLF